MRKILFFFLYSSAIFSQKNNVEGFYNTNENNYDTAIKLNSDYTYDFINSSGYYTVEGNEITLIPKFSFEIEKKHNDIVLEELKKNKETLPFCNLHSRKKKMILIQQTLSICMLVMKMIKVK